MDCSGKPTKWLRNSPFPEVGSSHWHSRSSFAKHRQQAVTERLDAVYRDLPERRTPNTTDAGLESLRELTASDSW